MSNLEILNDRFTLCILQAVKSLRTCDYEKSFKLIGEAMRINPDAPHPHNLLGILYELTGDSNKARRHFRAAYSLDPTYKPACKNLDQICTVFGNDKLHTCDFGDETEEG